MVWIVALVAAWLAACVLLASLTRVAARSDRPTPDHLALLRARRARPRLWLPPHPDRDEPA
jgi:hypothetical protein